MEFGPGPSEGQFLLITMIGSGVDTGQSRAETDMLAKAGAIFHCGAGRKMVCTSK